MLNSEKLQRKRFGMTNRIDFEMLSTNKLSLLFEAAVEEPLVVQQNLDPPQSKFLDYSFSDQNKPVSPALSPRQKQLFNSPSIVVTAPSEPAFIKPTQPLFFANISPIVEKPEP
jgi:hypothetical protein